MGVNANIWQRWFRLAAMWLVAFLTWATMPEGAANSPLGELERQLVATPTNTQVLVQIAKLHHNESTLGLKDAAFHTAQARSYLERLLAVDPKHAFGRALLGSTTVLTAREAFWPGTKIKRVREGLALMDLALADAPGDHNARFTRAVNNLFLPDMFDRRSIVEADFKWLRERVDRGEFEAEFRQYVLLYYGRAWLKWELPARALEAWQLGLDIDPRSKVADELRRELATSVKPPPQ